VFGRGWKTGTATIVRRRLLKEWWDAPPRGAPLHRKRFEYIVDVEPDDESPPFRTTMTDSWLNAMPGERRPVKHKKTKVKFDADRILPRRTGKPKRSEADDATWQSTLDAGPE
jgi:hypothetical protein